MRNSMRGLLFFLLLLLVFSPDSSGMESKDCIPDLSRESGSSKSLAPLVDYPVAEFSADMTSGAIPLTVSFTDLSTGTVNYWEWDLDGDGGIDSYEQNPTFVYEEQGVYTVSLYVSGPYGEDKMVKSEYIEALIGGGEPGTIKWSVDVGEIRSSPAVDDNGVIYVGSYDGSLYAIEPDGDVKWSLPTGGSIVTASPAIGGDAIYIASRDGSLYAVDANGAQKWKVLLQDGAYSDGVPAIGTDGSVFVGTQQQLFAVSSEGEIKWARSSLGYFGNPVTDSSGVVYVMERRQYEPDRGNFFVAYDRDGIEIWRVKLGSYSGGHLLPPAMNQRNIFVPSSSGLAALSRDGAIEWWAKEEIECDHQTPPCYGTIGQVSSVVVGSNAIYLGTSGGDIYAVSPQDGIALWKFHPSIVNAGLWGTPCVGDDGTVYALYYTEADNLSGRLYAINPDGTEKWYCTLGTMNANSSSPVIHNGALYVGIDFGSRFYSINVSGSSLDAGDWPCLHGGRKHTGRYDVEAHPPLAGFAADVTTGEAPLAVSFTDDSYGSITGRLWNFGDGATSAEQSPSHTYANAGSYTVALTVAGESGTSTETKTDYITVTPLSTGSLNVVISPQGAVDAGAKWRLLGETEWRDAGLLTGLPIGAKTVELKPVEGWITPANQTVEVVKDATVTVTGAYVQEKGSLTVVISPQGAVSAGARWTIDGGATWRESGATATDLTPGQYVLELTDLADWRKPESRTVEVAAGGGETATAVYTPLITIVAADPYAAEPRDKGRFVITRYGDALKRLDLYYTVSGTAGNGKDYKRLNGRVVMKRLSSEATITIKPKNDRISEETESVTVTLSNGESATISIADND